MNLFHSIIAIAAVVALSTVPIGSGDTPDSQASLGRPSVDLAFTTHLDLGLPEQDVFIEREPGSGEVFRVTNGDHDMSAPLFASGVPVPHNPFSEDALGPFRKGKPLGLTLGRWLRQSGRGTYSCTDGIGRLDLTFTNLVPEGVYTMWHAFMPAVPPEPFTGTLDLPLGTRDGSDSVFKASASGDAQFVQTFSPCLEMSDIWTTSMLAISWHSDGRTYGGHPGEFGYASHVPLFVLLPTRSGL